MRVTEGGNDVFSVPARLYIMAPPHCGADLAMSPEDSFCLTDNKNLELIDARLRYLLCFVVTNRKIMFKGRCVLCSCGNQSCIREWNTRDACS